MANPFRDFFMGQIQPKRAELVEAIEPRRTFNDVIVPASTRRALDHALIQIQKHDLIFQHWGLGERHSSGRGLAFNFAGPPGTGKTICAEAIAHALGKKLMVVRYSEVESLWAGETGKNVSAMFRAASEQDAVLFFDEADAIASRRFASVTQGFQREANTVVNVLLKELEDFDGVVIFATNLAANFDPAFERRIRTHILFAMPGAAERAQIWKVQLHARKTPLAEDVDFDALAERFPVAGGDIKNAVLKAAQMATLEPGADNDKKIHQRHFWAAMEEVIAAKKVMEQTLFEDGDGSNSMTALAGMSGEWNRLSRSQETIEREMESLLQRIGENEQRVAALPGIVERFDDAARSSQLQLRAELLEHLEALAKQNVETSQSLSSLRETLGAQETQRNTLQTELQSLNQQIVTERAGVLQAQKETQSIWETRWKVALALGVLAIVIAIIAVAT
jgi:DNA polymerase III delta prime subunit